MNELTAKLIILRGNSGSGKTTIAKELQNSFQRGKAMVVSQDEIRLGILNTKDRKDNPAIELIRLIAEYGKNHCEYVIVEGILGNNKYRDMLIELMDSFDKNVYVYYFDLPFDETLVRHSKREKSKDFGPDRMKEWWLEKDYLSVPGERKLGENLTQKEVTEVILRDLSY